MLYKHTFRYVLQKNRWLFAAISALLIIMSILFFSLVSLNEKMNQVQQVYKENKQEHFQFIPKPVDAMTIEETVNDYAKSYNFIAEQQHFKLISDENMTYKIVKQQQSINLPLYVSGKKSVQENEIVIDVNTANRLQLEVGDFFTFLNTNYEISGIAGFPGQIQPNMKLIGFGSYIPEYASLIEFTDTNFEQIKAEEKIYYSGFWLDDTTERELDANQFYMLKHAKDNLEINALPLKISMNQMIAGISIGVLMTIVLIMLAMLVYRMIKDNEEIFGVLKGIGYKNHHIISSFLPIIVLLLIPLLLGKVISVLLLPNLFTLMNQDGIMPYIDSASDWLFFIIVLLGFLFITAVCSMLLIATMIRKSPIILIRGVNNEKIGWIKRLLLKAATRKSILLNLKNKFILRNPFVLGLMVFTGFALAVQLLLSFAMFAFPNQIVEAYEKQFTHRYDMIFAEKISVEASNQFVAYEHIPYTFDFNGKQEDVELYALQLTENNEFISFYDYRTDKNITNTLSEGVVISKWFANKYDLQVGDELKLLEAISTTPLAVAGIHKGLQGNEAYTTVSYYNSLFSEKVDSFSGVYTNTLTHTAFNDDQVSTVIELEETLLAVKQSTNQYKMIGLILLAIGIILSIILMSIALYIMLQNNKDQILLFKAMGYRNKEIFTISINGYLTPLLIGVVVAIPYFIILSKLLFGMISKGSTLYIPMEINVVYLLILLVSTTVFFYLISLIFMRNISKDKSFIKLMSI